MMSTLRRWLGLSPKPQEAHDARPVRARYDAAGDTDEFKNYWAAADALDADSSNSREVREKLVQRSRYEVGNNGYVDGMTQTHVDYLVGTGPKLRMQSNSRTFNELVERQWMLWTKAVNFRRKLWTQAHAKGQDGEGLGYAATNPGVNHSVQMDYVLIETEQCQTPFVPFDVNGYIDGIRFDEFGNVLWYDVVTRHPGSREQLPSGFDEVMRVPARQMMHWYQMRRPGQHRGIPENKSTLTCGASSRRWREAILAAAESAAELNIILKTQMAPNIAADYQPIDPFSSMEITRRMMTAAPAGHDLEQIKSEHPNAQYKDFLRAQINEQGRPKSMPVNVAMGDSSDHNFASGKLDHMPWHQRMKVERDDCSELVLDPLFSLWFEELAIVLGFRARSMPRHQWDWPALPVADERARASSRHVNLQNGSTTLSAAYAEEGADFEEDVLPQMARDYFGDDSDESISEMRAILLQRNLGGPMLPEESPNEVAARVPMTARRRVTGFHPEHNELSQ